MRERGVEVRGGEGLVAGSGKEIVPVVLGRPEALDGMVAGDHLAAGGFAGLVRVKAAVDLVAPRQQRTKPRSVWPNSGCRDADALT